MAYLSFWQPLVDENAHTALTFGFLRHAPTDAALEPWLTEVLGRPIKADPLTAEAFWPEYRSIVEGSSWTEPELVFSAHDGAPLTVVIEAKPGYGQQRKDQVAREVVDAAYSEESKRVVCIMVGADLGPPMSLSDWHDHTVSELKKAEGYGVAGVDVELRYASWASLGLAARNCGISHPDWSRYAEDVVEQLRTKVLMGYDGAPALGGLEGGLTLAKVAEGFRRIVEASRQLFLALHGQPLFQELGLRPHGVGHRILRDGLSESPEAGADYFETTVLLALYRREFWPKTRVVFAGVYLGGGTDPELYAGMGDVAESGETMVYRWAHSDEPESSDELGILARADRGSFPRAGVYAPGANWIYDVEPWVPGRPAEDLAWVVGKLRAAVGSWEELMQPASQRLAETLRSRRSDQG